MYVSVHVLLYLCGDQVIILWTLFSLLVNLSKDSEDYIQVNRPFPTEVLAPKTMLNIKVG